MKRVIKYLYKFNILIKITLIGILIFIIILFIVNYLVGNYGKKYIINLDTDKKADAIIILGAYVYSDGTLSSVVKDRVDVGIEAYEKGLAPKILISGDHGQTDYDEVNTIRKYIESKGIEKEDIFMDHAGFSTYESLYRAKEIFEVENAIIVTQEYHLVRALYIGNKMGVKAYGITSDLRNYRGMSYYKLRDVFSRFKAFVYVKIKPKPTYLGEKIPITGDGRETHDMED
jgi:vancomycin permeability regulator SanA